MSIFPTKNALYGYFWARIEKKNYFHMWNQNPQICLFAKFYEKTIIPKFATKNVWFMYFWSGIWKKYCHIWNPQPRICLITKFWEKKCLILGQKNALFRCFCTEFSKNYCYISNQCLEIWLIAKLFEEIKMPKFETKNALFEYLWPKSPYLGIDGLQIF